MFTSVLSLRIHQNPLFEAKKMMFEIHQKENHKVHVNFK
jgi:hypothetical protein